MHFVFDIQPSKPNSTTVNSVLVRLRVSIFVEFERKINGSTGAPFTKNDPAKRAVNTMYTTSKSNNFAIRGLVNGRKTFKGVFSKVRTQVYPGKIPGYLPYPRASVLLVRLSIPYPTL